MHLHNQRVSIKVLKAIIIYLKDVRTCKYNYLYIYMMHIIQNDSLRIKRKVTQLPSKVRLYKLGLVFNINVQIQKKLCCIIDS